MRRSLCAIPVAVTAAAAALVLAGCSAGSSTPPDFRPSPGGGPVEGNHGVQASPIEPIPSLGSAGRGTSGSPSGSTTSSPGHRSRIDPDVVATHLSYPVGLSLLPDGDALVGERTTGRIVQVQPQAGKPVPTVRTLTGLDTSVGGGLLDLAVSPNYDEDNLIYAYISTRTDDRVVDFTLHGPVTPVLTGIPKGRSANAGRMVFGADGDLYVGTPAGRILRVDDIGRPAAGNPKASSPDYAAGTGEVDGLCTASGAVLEVQSSSAGRAGLSVITKGRRPTPVATLPAAADPAGGCAVLGSKIWVASLGGQALYSFAPRGSGRTLGAPARVLFQRYGRLRTVVAAPDGALWLTTSNRDGHGHPVPTDERVIRYLPQSGGNAGSTT